MKSFYSWCIENNRMDFIDLWSEYNKYTPYELSCWSTKKIMFEYEGNFHLYKLDRITYRNPIYLTSIKYKSDLYLEKQSAKIKVKKEQKKNKNYYNKNYKYYYKATKNKPIFYQSLYDWCIQNDRQDILDRWDYKLNNGKPEDYSSKSHCEVYLKCPRNIHESELYMIMSLTNMNIRAKCKRCNSFGQWLVDIYGIDAIDKYWDFERNNCNPFDIQIGSRKQKLYLKNYNNLDLSFRNPDDYVKAYERTLENAGKSKREKQTRISARKYLKDTNPEVKVLWSNKNNISFEEAYNSYNDTIVYWKCENGIHEDYARTIHDSSYLDFRCPICSHLNMISSLQNKTQKYIEENYNYTLLHEYKCNIVPINPRTNYKLPFDNELVELKLIIEVHGQQHYDITNFTILAAEQRQIEPIDILEYQKWKDNYKKTFAENNGYSYLELPYWSFEDDTYKEMIDSKISELSHESDKGSFLLSKIG